MRGRGWVLLAVATSVVVGFTYAGHAGVAPLIASEFGLDDVQLGLIATALYLAAAATMLVGSHVPDRYPARDVNALALVLVILGNAGLAAAPSYPVLLVARAVGGVGSAFALLGGLRYIARRYGEDRPHFAHGLYGSGFPLGSAVALWMTPAVGSFAGWRSAYWVATVAMIVVLLAWLRVRQVPPMARPGNFLDATRSLNAWWTSVQHAAGFGLALAAGTWIAVFIFREFSLPLEASGLLGSLLLLVAAAARPVGGYVLARHILRSLTVMRLAQVACLAGLALLILPDRPLALALAGAVLVGFGGGVGYSAVMNTGAASLPTAPGAAQGVTSLGGLVSALAGAPAMGYAIQTWGWGAAWAILAAISVVALAVTFVMKGEEELHAGS
ncbi:MAG TPA: MFS transporter [Candidatus Limnocylindria bacterium]|nr:MFS transporter [Candidatus Limnocylindria bacterium]